MEFDKKVLKTAAKITAATLSEENNFSTEKAEETVKFFKSLYGGILEIKESENCVKDAFKVAGKITASAFEEAEDPTGEKAAEFFKTVYEIISSAAESEDFDEDVFKYSGKITAANCEEIEEPDVETAKKAGEFFLAVYNGILADEPACNGKYSVKETKSGFSFCLLSGNNQVIGVSEVYSSPAALEKGIESVRKNAPVANLEDQTAEPVISAVNPKFEIYNDKAGEFRFRLKARNGEIILASEGYKTKASCEKGIESVRKNAPAKITE